MLARRYGSAKRRRRPDGPVAFEPAKPAETVSLSEKYARLDPLASGSVLRDSKRWAPEVRLCRAGRSPPIRRARLRGQSLPRTMNPYAGPAITLRSPPVPRVNNPSRLDSSPMALTEA